jgi:hypothetical protein
LVASKKGVIAGGEGSKYIGLQAFFDLGKTFHVTAFKRLAKFSMQALTQKKYKKYKTQLIQDFFRSRLRILIA